MEQVYNKISNFWQKASWITDFFRTDFQNQVLVDLENPQKIVFYNLDGKSFANSLQTQLDFSVVKSRFQSSVQVL